MFSYLFEARGIQQYIIETGKMKDMVGASLIVDSLCQYDGSDDLLQSVLDALQLDGARVQFSRRAGGAFVALLPSRTDAEALRDLWTLSVNHFAPGMEWVDALAEGASDVDAVKQGFEKLAQRRNRPAALLPEAGPFVMRTPRTGMAAFRRDRDDWHDLPTWRKRQQKRDAAGIALHCLPAHAQGFHWVESLDASENEGRDRAMPFIAAAEQTLGVIHADGNGLGIALQALQNAVQGRSDYREVYWKFSVAIAVATQKAAQAATQAVLIPDAEAAGRRTLAARPLVLGGDDLTIIVRGDLALDYLAEFIRHFEIESGHELAKVGLPVLPERLTACGGVAFIGVGQPFVQAYALAESLCKYAKAQSSAISREMKPSSLSFYRVSTAHIGKYPDILKMAERTHYKETSYQMTLGAYAVDAQEGLPALSDLRALKQLLGTVSGSTERELLTLMRQAPQLVPEKYARWRNILRMRDAGKLEQFDRLMARLGVVDRAMPFTGKTDDAVRMTPFGDVHALQSVLARGDDDE